MAVLVHTAFFLHISNFAGSAFPLCDDCDHLNVPYDHARHIYISSFGSRFALKYLLLHGWSPVCDPRDAKESNA